MTVDGTSMAMDYIEVGRFPILGSPAPIMPQLGKPGTPIGVVGVNGPVNVGLLPINVVAPPGVVNLSYNPATKATQTVVDIIGLNGAPKCIQIKTSLIGIDIQSSLKGVLIKSIATGIEVTAPISIDSKGIIKQRGAVYIKGPVILEGALYQKGPQVINGAVSIKGSLIVNGRPVCLAPCN